MGQRGYIVRPDGTRKTWASVSRDGSEGIGPHHLGTRLEAHMTELSKPYEAILAGDQKGSVPVTKGALADDVAPLEALRPLLAAAGAEPAGCVARSLTKAGLQ